MDRPLIFRVPVVRSTEPVVLAALLVIWPLEAPWSSQGTKILYMTAPRIRVRRLVDAIVGPWRLLVNPRAASTPGRRGTGREGEAVRSDDEEQASTKRRMREVVPPPPSWLLKQAKYLSAYPVLSFHRPLVQWPIEQFFRRYQPVHARVSTHTTTFPMLAIFVTGTRPESIISLAAP